MDANKEERAAKARQKIDDLIQSILNRPLIRLKPHVKRPHSINEALRRGLVPDLCMQEALYIVGLLNDGFEWNENIALWWPVVTKQPIGGNVLQPPAWDDPGWENVVRAYEEDR